MIESKASATDERESALQESPGEVVTRWLRELQAADTHEKTWRERAEKIVNLYKDERPGGERDASTTYRFNLLYANTEVLKGALYSQCPVPDIRRRFLEKDQVGRVAATVLTRAVSTTLDLADFDGAMRDDVQDMVLPGRGVMRVKYAPKIDRSEQRIAVEAPVDGAVLPQDVQQDEQGYFRMEAVEEVTYEAVGISYVPWDMYRQSPAKRWEQVRWVAYGELLTRDDLIKQFGEEIGGKVELKWMPKGAEDSEENQIFKRALVWLIYNKTDRKCYAVTDGYKDEPLKVEDDPLHLEHFFPQAKPLYSILTTNTLIPTPEYTVYQDHARQLDELNERIAILTDALRRRGVYDSSIPELENLGGLADNKFVPVKSYREFVEKGGLESAFQEMDISMLAKVLSELMLQAEAKKAQIYEIIGISDIMRGATKSDETLGAQQIKNEWGSIRIGPRQQEVQRFARDTIRIIAEIIAEHFSAQTLAQMSGMQLAMTPEERAQLEAVNPQDPRVKRPTWVEVMQVLKSDKLRSFRVDIETDSTIRPHADQEQKNRVELITAVTGYLEKALPAVQAGMVPKKFASELLMFGVRAFQTGSQIEELLDEWAGSEADSEQPSPEVVQLKQENEQLRMAADENMLKREEMGVKREEIGVKREEIQARKFEVEKGAETAKGEQEARGAEAGAQVAPIMAPVLAQIAQAMTAIAQGMQMQAEQTQALVAAVVAPRKRELMRGPDGKAVAAMDVPMMTQ